MLLARTPSFRSRFTKSVIAVAVGIACSSAVLADAEEQTELEEVVVTGFRGSLNTALALKRNETAAVDVIASEDIGKFPDSNLAESMQRIPSVTLSRGDGGEGRNISVRGLGPGFTRVRINGMEGAAQGGSSDIYGAGNNGRSFDFNVFPTEIFSQLAVRKTPSADVEEGSLGATVDLKAPRPFDYDAEQVFSITTRGIFNSVAQDVDPRASALFAKTFGDETFGILASAAYQRRNVREVGYSAVDILPASSNGLDQTPAPAAFATGLAPYCTPQNSTLPLVGSTTAVPITQSPGNNPMQGTTATACSTGNPRTSDPAAFATVYNMTNPKVLDRNGRLAPGGGAFFPRLPRFVNSEQDTERTGGTLSLQWAPSESTTVSFDGLISRYQVERRDNYILGLSLGRAANQGGQPMVSIRDVSFDDKGSVQTATFDGMDIRSEGLVDQFTSTFKQGSLEFAHSFSDNFKIKATAGRSNSIWHGPMRLQTFIDAVDVDNFTLDFRGRETPLIGFGNINVDDPNAFMYNTPIGNGDGTVRGGFSIQGKPSRNVTANTLFELEGDWQMTDTFALKGGLQWREANFKAKASNLPLAQQAVFALPSNVTLADITTHITDLDDLFGGGAPASWVAVDSKKWREVFNFPDAFDFCGVECAAAQNALLEEVTSAYAMLSFNFDQMSMPIRGDIGGRYVNTRQSATGHIPLALPMGAAFGAVGFRQDIDSEYKDFLPSLNVVMEFRPDLLARFSAAKVMSRPELGVLTPSVTWTATTQNATVNNPFLDPIRANTADLALEWYFQEGSLLSVAFFYKDIESFIQRITADEPWRNLGVPDAVLIGTQSTPDMQFHVGRYQNTEGGPLKGVELNAQVQFRNLPGLWSNTGFLANYTKVQSEIEYILSMGADPQRPGQFIVTNSATEDLVNLSRNSASATLFYDDSTYSARVTGAYRDKYIRELPAGLGSDVRANKANMFFDFASSWRVNDNLSMILEIQNLTRERNTLYIDSVREDTLFQTEIGRTYTLGATFKF